MTSTTHHAITDLAARLLIGALVLGVLILMGIELSQRPSVLADVRP